jgi:hypothetical protein
VISFLVPAADEAVAHRVHLRQANVNPVIESGIVVRGVLRFVRLLLLLMVSEVFLVLLVLRF